MIGSLSVGRRSVLSRIRPRSRRRESALLGVVAVSLVVGSVSLGATERIAGGHPMAIVAADPRALAVYLGLLVAVHLAQILAGRRTDQILLPAVGLLGGIGLLLMERLPQGLVSQTFFGVTLGLGQVQLVWLTLALLVIGTLAVAVRSDAWLRLYKYTWAAAGIVLLALTAAFGVDVNGERLALRIGPLSGQPSELLKVILVVFLAGYLSENRPLLVERDTRLGPLRFPPLPYLAPMLAMLAIAVGIVVIERDLGAALLFFTVFLVLLYIATGRLSAVAVGLLLFVAGAAVLYRLIPTVQTRVDIWLDPFADPTGAGYQIVQALHAFARGGIVGTGLGAGLPTVGGQLPIPAVETDFPLAALGEELGLAGVLAILGVYFVVIERGLRIAAAAADEFRAILAAGLSLVIGVQAFIIAAGNLKLIPLTGITLPFISYGGSSLLANAIVIGLLLAISDRGVELPPPPGATRASRLGRLRRTIGREAAPERAR
ncbi:MAG: FtsW/RodA/SpoVE family cell cycle protein [Candidatus Limnocylindrales bacterium]